MSKHPSFEELVDIFYKNDDELSANYKDHLESCESCKEQLNKMKELSERLRASKAEPSKEDFFTAKAHFINGTMDKKQEQKNNFLEKPTGFPVYLKYLAVAASIIAVIFVAILVTQNNSVAPQNNIEEKSSNKPVEMAVKVDSSKPVQPKIMALKGGCYIYENENLIPITKDSKLVENMVLRLHAGGSMFLEFGAKNQLLINEATFKIVKATENNIEFDLFSGSIASKVAPLDENQSFKIMTSNVTTRVVGTEFAVNAMNTGVTLVAVKEGKVEVRPRDGSGSFMIVEKGETFRIDQMHLGYKKKLSEDKAAEELFVPAKPYKVDKKKIDENRELARAMQNEGNTNSENAKAKKMLEQATKLQREKKYQKALDILDAIISKYPKTSESDQASYLTAENLLALGKIEDAAEAFEKVETKVNNANLVENSIYARAHILETRLKQPEAARALWHKYVIDYPKGMLREDAMYALCANVSQSPMKVETFSVCSTFAKDFPESFRTPVAILKAADAAWDLNRFDSAAILYESYSVKSSDADLSPILYRLGASLLKIGKTITAKQVFRRLKHKYPHSEYSRKADELLTNK